MAEISLARLDDRLIHGQVAITVLRGYSCKKVIVIDDKLINDSLQKQLLKAVCPTGLKFELISTAEAGKRWQEDKLGSLGPIIILFKDVKNIYTAYKAGLVYKKLQIGGQRDTSENRKHITAQISLNEEEAKMLDEIQAAGTEVFVQQKPQDRQIPWASIKASYFPSL